MDNLEKVELVREKSGVSYAAAKDAREANDSDVRAAPVYLERAGKTTQKRAAAGDETPEAAEVIELVSVAAADTADEGSKQQASERTEHTSSKANDAWKSFCATCKKIVSAGMEMTFVAERDDERVLAIPVLVVVLGLLFWGASLWLLIIGLFFGFRYHIEGEGTAVSGINDAMDKAADGADSVKENFA